MSICTTPEGSYYKEYGNFNNSSNEKKHSWSKIGYNQNMKMWKSYDYRCLKPKENIIPEEWPHYEMEGYRKAKTEKELNEVDEIKFDKYFFNLEDPQIFNDMILMENRSDYWKRTYGVDFATSPELSSKATNLECYAYCFKAEFEEFALDCKRKGGFFKCCRTVYVIFFSQGTLILV